MRFSRKRHDVFAEDIEAKRPRLSADNDEDGGSPAWASIILLVTVFFVCAITWSAFATVDELSRADGKVIPSGKTKIIQSAESGVVLEILVRDGQVVREGQVLMRLDNTATGSSLGEVEAKIRTLTAVIARLNTEYEAPIGTDYQCPPELDATDPQICANEANLLRSRYASLANTSSVLVERVEQRERELAETNANVERLENNLELAVTQLELVEPLAQRKLVAATALIERQREVSDLTGQIATARETVGRLEAQVREAHFQLDQAESQFREEALSLLTEHLSELTVAQETQRGAADRVYRTEIRSPVDGIVGKLEITTVGAFVNAGTRVMDIVPLDDTLRVEAQLRPSDVAFVIPGQTANIKLTAYDFSVYGGLEGIVETVSADSYFDENTRETFYSVIVSTDQSFIQYHDQQLPIFPGMVTQVEILTGRKTVLHYLLKPINKARNEALTER